VTKLSVNVNKVALLRNTRGLGIPSVIDAARAALVAGADGITVHPRPDERHVRPHDVDDIARLLRQEFDHRGGTPRPKWAGREFNIEGNPFEGRYVEHCERTRPDQATLVPDTPGQSTSDHGWDLAADGDRLKPVIVQLKRAGCRVSLFMDADHVPGHDTPGVFAAAAAAGAERVELYTEPYARRWAETDGEHIAEVIDTFAAAAEAAHAVGLGVNAGHDLNLDNLADFLAGVPHVAEVSIGHALIADALHLGMEEAVRRYVALSRGG